jgi:hypothetical protein
MARERTEIVTKEQVFEAAKELSAQEVRWLVANLKRLNRWQSLRSVGEFAVGDRVRIVDTVRPMKLALQVGRVVGRSGSKVVIDLDRPCGRWYRGVRCEGSLLVKVAS